MLANSAVGGRGGSAAPNGGGGFTDYAVASLYYLRIHLKKSYHEILPLERDATNTGGYRPFQGLSSASLDGDKMFDRINMAVWRMMRDPSGHAAMDATFSTAKTRATTTAAVRIIPFGRSTQPHSSIQLHELFSTFTARPRNVTTRSSAADKDNNWKRLREKLSKRVSDR